MEKIQNLKVRLTALSLAAACTLVALPSVAYAAESDEVACYEQVDESYSQGNLPIENILEIHNYDDLGTSGSTNTEAPEESTIIEKVVDKAKGIANGVGNFFGDFAGEVGEFFSKDNYARFILGGAGGAVAIYALREIGSTVKEVRTFTKEINGVPVDDEPQKVTGSRKKKEKKEKSKKLR